MNAKLRTAGSSRSKLTALWVLCGLAGAATAGAANVSPIEGEVPAIAVKYDAQSLASEDAVRALYARIVVASREVCPDMSVGHRWADNATAACRKQAIARAVKQVNNPRLAALYDTSSKRG